MKKGKVTGLEQISENLNQKVKDIQKANIRGFIKSIIVIQNALDKTTPVVPVDLGNLRASFFSVTAAGVGTRLSKFTGEDAGEMEAEHSEKVAEAAADVIANKGMIAIIGFSANYSWWVHENVGSNVNWNRPGSGPKFFSSALENNKDKVLQIIKEEVEEAL
jgi:carbon starvation protein CstA